MSPNEGDFVLNLKGKSVNNLQESMKHLLRNGGPGKIRVCGPVYMDLSLYFLTHLA